jgi:hypothetical protein
MMNLGRLGVATRILGAGIVVTMLPLGAPASAQQVQPAPAHVVPVPAPPQNRAMARAQVPAPVPIVLPHPPPITNATSSTLFAVRLAIARAQQIDPQAAQTASFQYVQAIQQLRTGNIAAANISALAALATVSSAQVRSDAPAPLPTPALEPAAPQAPGLAGGLYGADAPAIDADSFLALARGIVDDCTARNDPRLTDAKRHYAQAEQHFAVRDWQATRIEAKAAIDACAKAQR